MSFPLSLAQAKVDKEVIDYKDLAAIPRVKAIYDVERPDLMSYESKNKVPAALDNKENGLGGHSPIEVTSSQNNFDSHINSKLKK